jgi:hypothetical protein
MTSRWRWQIWPCGGVGGLQSDLGLFVSNSADRFHSVLGCFRIFFARREAVGGGFWAPRVQNMCPRTHATRSSCMYQFWVPEPILNAYR